MQLVSTYTQQKISILANQTAGFVHDNTRNTPHLQIKSSEELVHQTPKGSNRTQSILHHLQIQNQPIFTSNLMETF